MVLNPVNRDIWINVLPDCDHTPTSATELCRLSPVTRLVFLNLFPPPPAIVLRQRVAPWTTVPKTPMDEYRYSTDRQHDVRSTRQVIGMCRNFEVHSSKGSNEKNLWRSVFAFLSSHPQSDTLVTRG
jgi:hypothetical protein